MTLVLCGARVCGMCVRGATCARHASSEAWCLTANFGPMLIFAIRTCSVGDRIAPLAVLAPQFCIVLFGQETSTFGDRYFLRELYYKYYSFDTILVETSTLGKKLVLLQHCLETLGGVWLP